MKKPQHTKWKSVASLLALLAFTGSASAGLVISAENQNPGGAFTPTWPVVTGSANLLNGISPVLGSGNFTMEGAGGASKLTDGAIGPVSVNPGWQQVFATCGNGGGSGNALTYSLNTVASPLGLNVTNITVFSGWGDNGRDAQAYTIWYSTVQNPNVFLYLSEVGYNPNVGGGRPSANRVIFSDKMGTTIAPNVAKLKFDFTTPGVENGWVGYSEITVQGTPSTAVTSLLITEVNQTSSSSFVPSWPLETGNLIANEAPTTSSGSFTVENCGGVSTLTDGQIGTSSVNGTFASAGGGDGSCTTLIYPLTNSINGIDLTNIVVYSGWGDFGRDGQFYTVSYATVSAPSRFIPVGTVQYNPSIANGLKSANRVSITTANGAPLGVNVCAVKFDFDNKGQDYGRSAYSEIVVQGVPSSGVLFPYLTDDTLPGSVQTFVGDSITFTAGFSNSPACNLQWQVVRGAVTNVISGATGATLTLNNLQVSDSGFYQLKAVSIADGTVTCSTLSQLTVTSPALAVKDVVIGSSVQTGPGATIPFFSPTWTAMGNNLLLAPSDNDAATNNFGLEGCSTNLSVLTDGAVGPIQLLLNPGRGAWTTYCTMGNGAAKYVTYDLPASETGYDITNIVVYGGWGDRGRDAQQYEVLYSTVLAPTNFIHLATVNYNPNIDANVQSATRTRLMPQYSALATHVAKVKFNYAGNVENNYVGVSEFVVNGVVSTAPYLTEDTLPSSADTYVGDSITFTVGVSNSPAANLQWQVVKNGVTTNIPGATGMTLTLNNLTTNDIGSYQLKAVNTADSTGVAYSLASPLTVHVIPAAVNGIIMLGSDRTGLGALGTSTNFYPNWTAPEANLITGATVAFGPGTYGLAGCNQDPQILNDGSVGFFNYYPGFGGSSTMVSMGGGTDGPGQDVIFALPSTSAGYDLTNIVVYGGWGNSGRDAQHYEVLYSTVLAPDTFLHLAFVDYNPNIASDVQSATRSILIPSGAALVKNVAQVKFLYFQQGSLPESGWVGVSEIVVGGKPSIDNPIMTQDIMPLTAADVVGSKVTISAAFNSFTPLSYQWQKDGVNLPGATSPTLTLTNLQVSDTATNGGYVLVASNVVGIASSRGCALTVNPVPAPISNIVASVANQSSDFPTFSPTWDTTGLTASLISGQMPNDYGTGNFKDPDVNTSSLNLAGGTPVLTDGNYGNFVPGGPHPAFATCGANAGQYVTYKLDTTASPNGYDLSKIAIAGGWNDSGRDAQYYVIYYSLVTSPEIFTRLTSSANNPVLANNSNRSVTRTTFTPVTGILAANVAAVKIDFTQPGNENAYCGYSEISVYGSSSTTASTNLVIATENQNTTTPGWTIESSNLIAGQMPSDAGSGNFSRESAGGPSVLTDGKFLGVTVADFATCGGWDGPGLALTYTSANGWNLTNIVVYSGWGNYDRDGQFYDIYYSTLSAPRTWIKLTTINYNPAVPASVAGSANRVAIAIPNGGLANVAAVKFDFSIQQDDHGYSGYSEIVLQGSDLLATQPVITREHQEGSFSWSVETSSLIAGKLPSSVIGGAGGFTGEGCNVTNLTDGVIGFGAAFGASAGADTNFVTSLTFNSVDGWNLTNIVVYTLWSDYGREGQYYDVSYSTLSNPTAFLPLANVTYNPFIPTGILSANRVSIAPMLGQSMLASNVAAIKFNFTPQGNLDYGWSGYSEIVLQGSTLTPLTPTAPVLSTPRYSGGVSGNLIMTGTGGTPNAGYAWLTTTNVALPLSSWTISTTGVLDGAGSLSNALPVSASQPAQFFKLKMQ